MSQPANYNFKGITCLIPNKNGASFLGYFERYFQFITDIPLEILVVDDHSGDDSLILLKRWATKDSRVKVLSNPGVGLVDALNFGIENASFEWIARFDIDDEYSPNRLDFQASLLDGHVVLIFSDYEIVAISGSGVGLVPSPVYHSQIVLSLFSNRRTPHSSSLFSKSAAIAAGLYRQEEYLAEDLGLWLRLSDLGTLRSYPEPLIKYRISQSSILGQNRVKALIARNYTRRNFSFLHYAEDASFKLRQTRDSYLSLDFSDERFILHLIEIIEIYFHSRKISSIFTCLIRAVPLLKFRHLPSVIRIFQIRIRKNKLYK